jgi:hypothetical protein
MLKKIGLDLLCVAAHYSNRYENSDKFIDDNFDEELKSYTFYLKNSNQNNIVLEFCDEYLTQSEVDCKIEWKNLHFVWKQFLSKCSLPNVIYSNTLKLLFKEKYKYDNETDTFIGVTSKYFPFQNDFIQFWEKTITINPNLETSLLKTNDTEFEIDELHSLFKLWLKQNSEYSTLNGNISEENILKIIKHFFPFVEIVEDKFIFNISCSMWNKNDDIQKSLKLLKDSLQNSSKGKSQISFDFAYNYYFKYCNLNSLKRIAGKQFFENYLKNTYATNIIHSNFIETKYL